MTYCYIGGYGRSGSTLIDIILGNQKDVISLGAIDNIWNWIDQDNKCACEATLEDCDFWSKILVETEKRLSFKYSNQEKNKLCKSFESIYGIKYLILGKFYKDKLSKYIELQNTFLEVIKEFTKAKIIVDSSKTTYDSILRPFLIGKYVEKNILLIHLKRKLGGVTWSSMKKAGSPERKRLIKSKFIIFLKSYFSCIVTDLLTTIIYSKRNYYFSLKYENYVSKNGIKIIQKIFEEFAVDLKNKIVFKNLKSYNSFHNIGGNRLRFEKGIKIKYDESWIKNQKLFFKFLCSIGDLIRYY